jgi:aspartate aminotransferase
VSLDATNDTHPGLAAALTRLGTETAFSVLARAKALERQGRDVIHLEIGEPDFDTPAHIQEAACAAIRGGETHYCPAAGLPEFQDAIADYFRATRQIDVAPSRVLVGTGAKPFLFFTILAVANPGDEIVYPDPGFPIYESAIRWAGATPVPLALHESRRFEIDVDELRSLLSPRTKLVILNSPHNPTGGAIGREQLADIAEALEGTDAWILSDEVYSRMLYEGTFASLGSNAALLDRTVVLDGLSKTYAMTGWRCGFAVVPEPLLDPLTRFFINSTSCVPPFVQRAGIAALTGPQDDVDAMVAEFRQRRSLVVDGLNAIPGVACQNPLGAFYAFPNVGALPIAASELADRLLDEAGVAVLAGDAFGAVGRENLRVSYANSQENLREALDRIGALIGGLS